MALPQRVKIAEQIIHRLRWDELDRSAIRRLFDLAHDESRRSAGGSHGESGAQHRTVEFEAVGDFVFCGATLLPLVVSAFAIRGDVRVRATDGAVVSAGTVIAVFTGPTVELRAASQVAHAFLSRLSGIATFAKRHADALGHGRTRLLDNSATTPGWSTLERFALACGGAWSGGGGSARIRIDVDSSDASRLKFAVRRARDASPDVPVELIVRRQEDVEAAAMASPDLIRLERFSVAAIREAVARVGGRVFVEAHGGITLSNLAEHAGLGLDFVSVEGLVSDAAHAQIDRTWRD